MESNSKNKAKVLLIAFYNKKALGVRYLEAALRKSGSDVCTVFFKDFNSLHPKKATGRELELLRGVIGDYAPDLIAMSVMSSMYLDTVNAVLETVRGSFSVPLVCGGAFATMFPEYFLTRGVSFVIRCDGENAICALAKALKEGTPYQEIPSLCYLADGEVIRNPVGGILNDIDGYGIPVINSPNSVFIENDSVKPGDPQLDTLSYEVIASRGCPFTCSYCCCTNLRKLLPPGIRGVRTRSVKSVIEELVEAKKQCRRIVFVHFYDEIFPNLPGWVEEFVEEYKKHIGLPFTIWSHPKAADGETLRKLVSAGLVEVIMGIQTGSERIRREVFHRYETQEEIIRATEAIRDAGVFWRSYDFMLQHPFETIEDLKESYRLVKRMAGPFELQLHGLNFLPGTDIVPMAIEQGYYTPAGMDAVMYAPMEEQFDAYWRRETSRESDLWYKMLYCYQFRSLRGKVISAEKDPAAYAQRIDRWYKTAQKLAKVRYFWKKGRIGLRRMATACKG